MKPTWEKDLYWLKSDPNTCQLTTWPRPGVEKKLEQERFAHEHKTPFHSSSKSSTHLNAYIKLEPFLRFFHQFLISIRQLFISQQTFCAELQGHPLLPHRHEANLPFCPQSVRGKAQGHAICGHSGHHQAAVVLQGLLRNDLDQVEMFHNFE